MTKKHLIFISLIVGLFFFASCSKDDFTKGQYFQHRGGGEIEYTAYEPLSDKPITLHYYIPTSGNVHNMPILFSLHGSKRDGQAAVDYWKELAEKYGFIVIAPQFSLEYYPKEYDYRYGGVVSGSVFLKPVPEEKWTLSAIEPIFDFVCNQLENESSTYDIWGHSAGGQFVQRFLLCKPEARVHRAVSANAGTYAMITSKNCSYDHKWPFGIVGSPFDNDKYLLPYYERDFYVTVGGNDTKKCHNDVEAAAAQGSNRLSRAKFFYQQARNSALDRNVYFNWNLSVVDGCSHTAKRMVYGACQEIETIKVYNVDDFTTSAAFWIIYHDRFNLD